ncbi:MAG TPA: sucrase/ferredoxin-like family protein, partial [Acidobacteriota bacterium]|nr:sucrase/ferredoxin-like family protein [Acidobacteriota bacterium]
RCGVCGPPLVEAFRTALDKAEDAEQTFVYACSHVGGHVYAGNVLIYPGGDWYGHVTPEVVRQLVDRHLGEGEILWEYWRGRTWLTPEEQCKLGESSGS